MRKLVLLLVSLYLLGSTELHQVLKLPLLIEHYKEHNGLAEMTFWEFLVMHYETDVPHDDTDMSLPFKDCHHSQVGQFLAVPIQKFTVGSPCPTGRLFLVADRSDVRTSKGGEIFQPPRA